MQTEKIDLRAVAARLDTLLSKVALALSDSSTSSKVLKALIEDGQREVPEARREASRFRQQLLDPSLSRDQISAARELADDTELDCERLAAALANLAEHHDRRISGEAAEACARRYQEALALRDAAAGRIADEYPKLLASLVDLIEEIMAANEAVDRVNSDLPIDTVALERPEGVARGFPDRGGSYETLASLTSFRITQAVLPGIGGPDEVAWPRVIGGYQLGLLQHGKTLPQGTISRLWHKSKD